MVDWLRQTVGLPADCTGTIHDSATSATRWALEVRDQLGALPGVEIVTEPRLSLSTFALAE